MGVGPYYIPEEIVYAAGAVPFGVWGAVGTAVEAKKYFPPFYCSICQMTLEMGLTHKLDKLSGILVSGLCDTLRAFSQNWKAGVGNVPMVYVAMPQNRKIAAGRTYAIETLQETVRKVGSAAGRLSATKILPRPSSCTTNGVRLCASSCSLPALILRRSA